MFDCRSVTRTVEGAGRSSPPPYRLPYWDILASDIIDQAWSPFKWKASSYHVAPGFETRPEASPWRLLLTSMLVDEHQQEDDDTLESWNDVEHAVPASLTRHPLKNPTDEPDQKWVRRSVFTNLPAHGYDPTEECVGNWLVAARVWGETQEWVDSVDIRRLAAFSTVIHLDVHQQVEKRLPGDLSIQVWNLVYRQEVSKDGLALKVFDEPVDGKDYRALVSAALMENPASIHPAQGQLMTKEALVRLEKRELARSCPCSRGPSVDVVSVNESSENEVVVPAVDEALKKECFEDEVVMVEKPESQNEATDGACTVM
ncbi:hypothetical protein CKAH01_16037 [Colletotrichum kahawae]|uniref:Uncharacterized protein n=1 Tax=Colletotrichum kahawae TaxID=34407 RepID=A0AAD9YIP3_COLKA|nr:hypothetical protein CKAH01_16037 [Colletotrichum kahawae]